MKDCNFIPAEFVARQARSRVMRWRAGGVVAVVAAMGVWCGVNHHELASAETMYNEVAQQHNQVRIHISMMQNLKEQRASLDERSQMLQTLSGHVNLVVVFADMSRRIPDSVALTEVRLLGSDEASQPQPLFSSAAPPSQPKPKEDPTADSSKSLRRTCDPLAWSEHVLVLTGAAKSTPDILAFAAAMEKSPLITKVRLSARGVGEVKGRKAELFDLACDLAKQKGADGA